MPQALRRAALRPTMLCCPWVLFMLSAFLAPKNICDGDSPDSFTASAAACRCGFCGAEGGDLMAAGACLPLGGSGGAEEQCAAQPGHRLYSHGCPSLYTGLILVGEVQPGVRPGLG